jgi:hypothetical protein
MPLVWCSATVASAAGSSLTTLLCAGCRCLVITSAGSMLSRNPRVRGVATHTSRAGHPLPHRVRGGHRRRRGAALPRCRPGRGLTCTGQRHVHPSVPLPRAGTPTAHQGHGGHLAGTPTAPQCPPRPAATTTAVPDASHTAQQVRQGELDGCRASHGTTAVQGRREPCRSPARTAKPTAAPRYPARSLPKWTTDQRCMSRHRTWPFCGGATPQR